MSKIKSMSTAPIDGTEILIEVKQRAGVPGKFLVGHYMKGGIYEDGFPPVEEGWYFWNGSMFDKAAEPIGWTHLLVAKPLKAPTDNGIEKLDSICNRYNDGDIDICQLVCTVWNTALNA